MAARDETPEAGADIDALLDEQIAYYHARAGEYDLDMWQLGTDAELTAEVAELEQAFELFAPRGDVLELGCGTGLWTARLTRWAERLTAVDASPDMIARARERTAPFPVEFVLADLFGWRPPRRFDVVLFSFVLSHVPPERFDAFWQLVRDCLRPDGRVFFLDEGPGETIPEEVLADGDGSLVRRRLRDGRQFRVVKVFLTAAELEDALRARGWHAQVHETARTFYWGTASPPAPEAPTGAT